MSEKAKLTGYILINENGKRLNHNRWWLTDSEGWIWKSQDIEKILAECGNWEFKPVYKQAAYLDKETGQTVAQGEPEKL